MPLETPKKRRMWVLPAPIGEIDQASRASIVIEYAWVPWIRLAGEITAIFNSLFRQGRFSSLRKEDMFFAHEFPSVFVSNKEIK